MTVTLSVRRAAWQAHIAEIAGAVDGLLPVVKGNGYGFGRAVLHPIAATLGDRVCVGTVSELDHIAPGVTPIVLTPTLRPPADATPILTVGNATHVDALDGWGGRVVVKLRSSMRRYGVGADELPDVLDRTRATGLTVDGAAAPPPVGRWQRRGRGVVGATAARAHAERQSPHAGVLRHPSAPAPRPAALAACRHRAVARRQVVPAPRCRRARHPPAGRRNGRLPRLTRATRHRAASSSSAPARPTGSPRRPTVAARSTSNGTASPSSNLRTCTRRCASPPAVNRPHASATSSTSSARSSPRRSTS